MTIDPQRDLVLEQYVDVSPEALWAGWTQPALLEQWFTPAPWKTTDCHIDLRPGGAFTTVMVSPEGERHPNSGCYLEVVPNRRLTWTDALGADFRPTAAGPHLPFRFTATIDLAPQGAGTKYTAIARHADAAACAQHAKMGFHEGWGQVLTQLVALIKSRQP